MLRDRFPAIVFFLENESRQFQFFQKSGRRQNRTSENGNGSESVKHSFLPFFSGNLYGIVVVIEVAHVFEKLVELVVEFIVKLIILVKHVGYVERRIV